MWWCKKVWIRIDLCQLFRVSMDEIVVWRSDSIKDLWKRLTADGRYVVMQKRLNEERSVKTLYVRRLMLDNLSTLIAHEKISVPLYLAGWITPPAFDAWVEQSGRIEKWKNDACWRMCLYTKQDDQQQQLQMFVWYVDTEKVGKRKRVFPACWRKKTWMGDNLQLGEFGSNLYHDGRWWGKENASWI